MAERSASSDAHDRRRRRFIAGAIVVLASPAALGQPAGRTYRIGVVNDTTEGSRAETWVQLRKALGRVGLVEGRNLVLDLRHADGATERLAEIAAGIVAAKPDLILAPGTLTTRAAMRATRTIPIVFWGASDPVATGLIASLSRPGGNVTGVSIVATETSQKAFELLREIAPEARRIAYLTDIANHGSVVAYSRIEERARAQKVSVQMLDGARRDALEHALATIRSERMQALLVGSPGTLLDHRDAILRFAASERLPAVYNRSDYVEEGGLASFGVDRRSGWIRTAAIVRRILDGAKPGDIPVEQNNRTRLVINMKKARELGIRIPDAIRLRADEVVE